MSLYKQPLLDVPPITDLRQLLRRAVDNYARNPLFLDRKDLDGPFSSISYQQFYDDICAFGTALLDLGLQGQKIAIIGAHSYEWSVAYMAVVCGLGVVVPVDKELPLPEMVRCFNRAQISAAIYAAGKRGDVKAIYDKIKAYTHCFIDMEAKADGELYLSFAGLLDRGRALLRQGSHAYADLPITPEAFSILLFTSGTSSASKAVMLSHKNICANIRDVCRMIMFDTDDIFLSVLPIHHTYQCTCGFLLPMLRGARIAFCHDPKNFAKNLADSKTTILLGVPLIFESIHKHIYTTVTNMGKIKALRKTIRLNKCLRRLGFDCSRRLFRELHKGLGGNIRLFVSGAAGIDPKISKDLRNIGIPTIQGYGLTECSPIVAVNRIKYYRNHAAGLPLPSLDVQIVNQNSDGIGEIAVKGPSIMLGYYEQPGETARVFNAEGYFLTGDLGYRDKRGFLYITGRKRNVIVTKNGKTVFPEELEELLNRSYYIKECMVYARPKEKNADDMYHSDDDVLIAVSIVPDMDYIMSRTGVVNILSDESIKLLLESEVQLVNRMVSKWKQIRYVHVRKKEFMKNTTRKIQRYMENPEDTSLDAS